MILDKTKINEKAKIFNTSYLNLSTASYTTILQNFSLQSLY